MNTSELSRPQSSVRRWRQIGGIILGVGLLAVIIASASISDILDAIRGVDPIYLVIAFGLNLIMISLMAYRWYRLHGVLAVARPPYTQMLAVSLMSIFFSNFLPSMIGADAYRTYHMSRARPEEGVNTALSIVFVDRILGLLGMALVGLTALIFGSNNLDLSSAMIVWIGLLFFALILTLTLSMSHQFHKLLLRILNLIFRKRGQWLTRHLGQLFERIGYFNDHRALLLEGAVISIILRIVWIFSCYLTSVAMGLNLTMLAFLVAIPLIETIRMIPITLQGIGVREALFVLFFQQYGVSTADATVLAILIYTLLNLNSLIGGVLFLLRRWSWLRAENHTR